jgi:hypothetical protein
VQSGVDPNDRQDIVVGIGIVGQNVIVFDVFISVCAVSFTASGEPLTATVTVAVSVPRFHRRSGR